MKPSKLGLICLLVVLTGSIHAQVVDKNSAADIRSKVDSLTRIADGLYRQEHFEEIIPLQITIIDLQKPLTNLDTLDLGISYYNLGKTLKDLEEYSNALPFFIHSLPLLEKKHPNLITAFGITRYEIAELFSFLLDYNQAVIWGTESLKFLEKSLSPGDPNLMATRNMLKGWKDSLRYSKKIELKDISSIMNDLAVRYPVPSRNPSSNLSDTSQTAANTDRFYKQFLALLKSKEFAKANLLIKSNPEEANNAAEFLLTGGIAKADEYDYSGCLAHCFIAGMIFQQIDSLKYIKCLQWTGYAYQKQKQYKSAESTYVEMISLSEMQHNDTLKAWAYNDIGVLYSETGNFDSATKYLNQALMISKEASVPEVEGSCLRTLATIYLSQKNYSASFEYLEKASLVSRAAQDTLMQIAVLRDYARIYNDLSEYQKEFNSTKSALDLAENINDLEMQAMLNKDIGSLYYNEGQNADAMEHWSKAKKLYKKIGNADGELNVGIALIALYSESPHAALTEDKYLDLLDLSDKLSNLSAQANILINLGNFLVGKGEYAEAERSFFMASQLAADIESFDLQFSVAFSLGIMYDKKLEKEKSLDAYLSALEVINKIAGDVANKGGTKAKEFFFARREVLSTYRRLVSLYEKQGAFEKALNLADDIKSKLFYEHVLHNTGDAKRKLDSGLFDQEILLKKSLFELNELLAGSKLTEERIKEIRDEKDEIEKKIFMISQQFYEKNALLQGGVNHGILSTKALQNKIGSDKRAILEYYVCEKDVKLFLVTKKLIKSFSIKIEHHALLDSINELMHPIWRGNAQKFDVNNSHRLYKLLIAPALTFLKSQKLTSVTELVIIPDGALNVIPFELLVTIPDKEDFQASSFLSDSFAISYAVSASILLNSKPKQQNYDTDLTAVAPYTTLDAFEQAKESSLNKTSFSKLPYLRNSLDEAYAVSGLFQKSRLLLDTAATTKSLLLQPIKSKYLHLITHGMYDKEPENCGILMHNDILKFYELMNMNLQTDLVVLASCQSGMGSIIGSEGVIGLPRALLAVGANSVVASLWPVSDEATKNFMTKFYQLLQDGKTKPQALQKAKIWMRKESFHQNENNVPISENHPLFWAPFILIESTLE